MSVSPVQLHCELQSLQGDDQDTLARRTLRLVLEQGGSPEPQLFSVDRCPNCGQPSAGTRSPYCGECCREESAFVRQLRAALMNDAINDPERQAALGQKLWRLLGGGLPRRIALIPPKAFAKVLERKCETCGAPAVTIDNIGGG